MNTHFLGKIGVKGLLLVLLIIPLCTQAQTDCGDIVYEVFGEMERVPIENCSNPFEQIDGADVSGVSFAANGEEIFDAAEIELPAELPQLVITAGASQTPGFIFQSIEIYQHDGIDYQAFNLNETTITEPGTYTIVYVAGDVPVPVMNPVQKLFDLLVPTAHAQVFGQFYLERKAITIEVVESEPELIGASSVLFLPGIQASRLYKERSIVGEDRVWEPSVTLGNDFFDLAMTDSGESIENLYTKSGDVIDETRYIAGNVIVYETFLDRLVSEKSDGAIADYTTLAYDWRYDVRDIVQDGIKVGSEGDKLYPIEELEKLIEANPSGKVTIVAHSNGGLLAKAMLLELEEQCAATPNDPCMLDSIDQLILLGTPQTGTPQAISQLLHGPPTVELLSAFVLQPVRFRAASRNIPGAYGLVPGAEYFTGLTEPLIDFVGEGNFINQLKAAYPVGIETSQQLKDFMGGIEGRGLVGTGQLGLPAVLNQDLIGKGIETNDLLAVWQAPAHIEVIEIVGTGVITTAGISYNTVTERTCWFCPELTYTKPVPKVSLYGDETVMTRSAEGYRGEKTTYYVDLQSYNALAAADEEDNILPSTHPNLSEPADVQDLIFALVSSSSLSDSEYISTSRPEYGGQSYDGLSTHSPVHLFAEDEDGNQTGLITTVGGQQIIIEDIPGSRFYQIGSSSYLYVPSDISYEVFIDGYAEGSFSLFIDDIVEGELTQNRFRVENATTSASTSAVFTKNGGVFSDLMIDLDGDGQVEESVIIDEQMQNREALYAQLRQEVSSSSLSDRRKLLFMVAIDQTEQLGQLSTTYRFIAKLERKLLQQHIAKLKRWRDKERLSNQEFKQLRATIKEIIGTTRN